MSNETNTTNPTPANNPLALLEAFKVQAKEQFDLVTGELAALDQKRASLVDILNQLGRMIGIQPAHTNRTSIGNRTRSANGTPNALCQTILSHPSVRDAYGKVFTRSELMSFGNVPLDQTAAHVAVRLVSLGYFALVQRNTYQRTTLPVEITETVVQPTEPVVESVQNTEPAVVTEEPVPVVEELPIVEELVAVTTEPVVEQESVTETKKSKKNRK